MNKQDRIIAPVAMVSLIVFMGVLVGYVREPDLAIIVIVVLGFGVYDFWRTLKMDSAKSNADKAE